MYGQEKLLCVPFLLVSRLNDTPKLPSCKLNEKTRDVKQTSTLLLLLFTSLSGNLGCRHKHKRRQEHVCPDAPLGPTTVLSTRVPVIDPRKHHKPLIDLVLLSNLLYVFRTGLILRSHILYRRREKNYNMSKYGLSEFIYSSNR